VSEPQAVEDVEVAGSDSETEPESEPEAAKPWPIVTLDKTWEDHYRRMLILIYPLVRLPVGAGIA
jgi:hypothetical protein